MRVMLKAKMPVERANELAREGKLQSTIQSILDELKPEASYFVAEDGMRTALLFLEIKETSDLARIAEPCLLALDAELEVQVAMNAQDLAKASPEMQKAAKTYGA